MRSYVGHGKGIDDRRGRRHFAATRPNELWCTNITEHPARDGRGYCCAILGAGAASRPGDS